MCTKRLAYQPGCDQVRARKKPNKPPNGPSP